MKTTLRAATCTFALLVASVVFAQGRQDHTQFDQHDRQVTQDWYNQHQSNPPRGLRARDTLSAQEEARLQPGHPLDSQLRKKTHSVPSDLARRLPTPPKHHKYQTVGGHVVLVDTRDNTVRDVIHVHH
jgi:Ni/Co efflux regulator RcnB